MNFLPCKGGVPGEGLCQEVVTDWHQPPQNTQLCLHPPSNNSQIFSSCGGRIVFPAGEVSCEHSRFWEIY